MPESRIRRKTAYTPPTTRSARKRSSPRWVVPVMLVFFVLGVIWLSAYYISGGDAWLISALGGWNLAIGFGFILVGFALSTQWR